MQHSVVSATAGLDRRASSIADVRLWVLVFSLLLVFVLDVRLPEVVLLPFMVVPVVATATFASARATTALAVLALALGVASGVINGDFSNDDYWWRLGGVSLVAVLAVYLAHVGSTRERRLADGERRLQIMLDNTADAVFLLDADGVIRWASPSVERQLGYSPKELEGLARIDLVHFEDRREVESHVRRVARGETACLEERVRNQSGEYRWMSVAMRPLSEDDWNVGWQVASLRDVHEDVLLRDAVVRSERMFRMAMDGAAHGMAVVGLHQRFFEVNSALCQLVGRDQMWLADHGEDELLHPDEIVPTAQLRDRLLAGAGDHETRSSRVVSADGTTLRVEHALGLIRDEHGLPLFYVCQYNDLSEGSRGNAPASIQGVEVPSV